jgi:predicted metalloprotease with PDZ domain
LLDLSILNDTNGVASLDDVMRALYQDFYQKGKGFTTEDMIGIVNRTTKRDYRDFYRKYVSGVEVPSYDEFLGYAGYRAERTSRSRPTIGTVIERSDNGVNITYISEGSQAAKAGLRIGDIILSVNGMDLRKDPQALIAKLGENIGHSVKLSIKRGTQDLTIDVKVSTIEDSTYKVVEVPSPTPKQLKIREAWLKTMG